MNWKSAISVSYTLGKSPRQLLHLCSGSNSTLQGPHSIHYFYLSLAIFPQLRDDPSSCLFPSLLSPTTFLSLAHWRQTPLEKVTGVAGGRDRQRQRDFSGHISSHTLAFPSFTFSSLYALSEPFWPVRAQLTSQGDS